MEAKAKAMNAGKTLGKGQSAGGWTAESVAAEIKKSGMTVTDWYNKYGKAEGFAHGGITPTNRAFWVGEEGPELLMSPERYGILSNRESIDLLHGSRFSPNGRDLSPILKDIYAVCRAMLRELSALRYRQEKVERIMREWNQTAVPVTVA